MTTENRTLKAARAYHARGLAVFPLNNKIPVTPNGVKDASTDLAQVETWFDHARNIAIAVPPNVVVVDVDPRNGGAETFVEWTDKYGWPDDVPEAITGGNGFHFWFRYDGRKLVKTIGGVDFLRDGKYVVAPPSTTSGPYKWVTTLPENLEDLPEMPGWLLHIATPEEREYSPAPRIVPAGDPLDDAAHGYTTWPELLTRHGWHELAGDRWRHPTSDNQFSATIKHDCLFVYSPTPGFEVTETGDPHGVTLYNAIKKLDFGDDQRAMLQAFRDNGYLPELPTPVTTADLIGTEESTAATTPDDTPEPEVVFPTDFKALKRKDEDAEQRWLIEPIIAHGRAHVLYAGAKTGKSLLMLPLAAAAATGRAFLDYPGGDPIKTVYADYEMTEDDLKERLEGFGYDLDDDLLQAFLVYAFIPASQGLDTPVGGAKFVKDCLDVHQAQLVIVDTVSRAVSGAENDADTIRNFYRYTGWPLKRAGVAVERLDHAGKDAEKGQRGTSAKNDDVDIVHRLQGGDGLYKLITTHARPGWVERSVDLKLTGESDDGTLSWERAKAKGYPPKTAETVKLLDTLGAPLDMTQRDAEKLLRANGWKGRTEIVGAAKKFRESRAESPELAEAISTLGNHFGIMESA